ncbi:hypothetical protein UPYG_G00107170 [Umbra pygmaea]|uniref:Ig-like domain-containing protein n=1 Tax=Umbra pygmaea TaxID=75934 RepID=A0ABD0XRT9_UMBPY
MAFTPTYLLLLLTTSLSLLWQEAEAQLKFTIDSVTLGIDSSSEVSSGTFVNLICEVSVIQDQTLPLTYSFKFLHNDVVVYSKNTTDSSVFYELLPARAADSGDYKCQVSVQNKSKGSRTQRLVVTGLQTPTLIVSPKELYQGEEVTANCSAQDETGSLYFYFYLDEEKVKQVGGSGNSVETQLEMKNAGDRYLHCNYNILMQPDAGRSNNSDRVKVLVKDLFITPIMNIRPSKEAVEGDVVELICQVVNPPSNVTVYLTKDKTMLDSSSGTISHRLRVLAEDAGEYACKAVRNSMQKEAYKSIKVKELFSKPVLTMNPRVVFEGEQFKLNCNTDAYSPDRINIGDVKYNLYMNQVLLTPGGNYSGTAHPSLNGNYSCQAQALGRGQPRVVIKNSNTIVLQAKVPVSRPDLSVLGGRVILGKSFQLQCHSKNGSLPIDYTLLRDRRQVESRVVRRPSDRAIFNVTSIHRDTDIGSFSCQAQNHPSQSASESSREALQHIAIIEPVSTPELSLAPTHVAEGQDLTLTCTVQHGTPPITYTWYHSKSVQPLGSIKSNDMRKSHVVQGVGQEHGGGYYCVTINQSSDRKRSATVNIGVKLAGWKKGLIAAFCILLIASLLIVVIIKKCLLPFRRKRAGELSVKPASTTTDETLRLTHGTANEAANVTPGVMGKSVWSDHISGSESDDHISEGAPEIPETQYTEVQAQAPDPTRAPVKKGTDVVYSEVQNSVQGVSRSEQADGQGSVEYAQLNHNDPESEEQVPEPIQDHQ